MTALRSERRLAAREWSDKTLHLQNALDRSRAMHQEAVSALAEERRVRWTNGTKNIRRR